MPNSSLAAPGNEEATRSMFRLKHRLFIGLGGALFALVGWGVNHPVASHAAVSPRPGIRAAVNARQGAMNLAGKDLHGAWLVGANLSAANLRGADLTDANLQGALLNAHLEGANLSGANLNVAVLCAANLTGANLAKARLTGRST